MIKFLCMWHHLMYCIHVYSHDYVKCIFIKVVNDSITVFLTHLMKFTQAIHSYLRINRISTHVYNLYLSCTQKKKLFISLIKGILIKLQHTTTLIMASYWQSYWVISGTKLTKEGILLWLVRPDVRFLGPYHQQWGPDLSPPG